MMELKPCTSPALAARPIASPWTPRLPMPQMREQHGHAELLEKQPVEAERRIAA
ncbi:hypothetical protein ACFC5Z_38925 [Streptomyces sp. NPDC056004]|uniref:hypothetical protein n=1 Tax=Streptomyces sp. NPDC056004 TaxID=3345677 RepID=UPI0035D5CCFE